MLLCRIGLNICVCLVAVACVGNVAGQSPDPQQAERLQRADTAFRAGYAEMQAGHLERARADFAQAAQLAPQIPEGHEALGEVLLELGKPAEAAAELLAALNLKPGDQAIESNLALAYARAGDSANAVVQFKAAYEASQQPGAPPVDADFCQSYARALAATGKTQDAIQLFQTAIDRGAATADVFDALGSLYAQSSN